MGFAENVLNKIRGTPAFKPAAVDTFGNWAIEAGDIISVDNDGVSETIPIFSSDMNWNGSAITTIACTGNQKREIQDKQDRKDYAMSSGLSGYTNRKLEELSDSFGVELDNVRSALDVYVKETEDLQEASAALTTRVSGAETALEMNTQSIEDLQDASVEVAARVDGAEASIKLNAQNIDGVGKSVAKIQADVVELKGRVNLTDTAYVTEGHGLGVKGSIVGNGNLLVSGYIGTTANGPIMLAGKKFIPTEITSTSGTILVLGTA